MIITKLDFYFVNNSWNPPNLMPVSIWLLKSEMIFIWSSHSPEPLSLFHHPSLWHCCLRVAFSLFPWCVKTLGHGGECVVYNELAIYDAVCNIFFSTGFLQLPGFLIPHFISNSAPIANCPSDKMYSVSYFYCLEDLLFLLLPSLFLGSPYKMDLFWVLLVSKVVCFWEFMNWSTGRQSFERKICAWRIECVFEKQ